MSDLSEMSIQYEDLGVFLGFIKYPYDIDGKDLYTEIFGPFFTKHKNRISKYDPDALQGTDPYPNIYKPAGYRMFGSSGLAILSLVDDYSFYSRFFSINHIREVFQSAKNNGKTLKKEINTHLYEELKSVVISGVIEKDSRTIEDIAKETFLRTEDHYPYIGIIRLKIDYHLLVGKNNAVETIGRIKKNIGEKSKEYTSSNKGKKSFDYFAMDCYDNDEMTVIAFADDLLKLYNFLGDIRSIKNTDIGQKGAVNETEKHVFGMTYLGFGYDLNCNNYENLDGDIYRLNCAVETKPGHRDVFYKFLQQMSTELEIGGTGINISGGCSLYFSVPLKNIKKLEKICKTNPIIHRDVQEIKISLRDLEIDSGERHICSVSEENHLDYEKRKKEDNSSKKKEEEMVENLRNTMKKIGISKVVRDRLLALIEFYNYSCQNILQSGHLKELKPVLNSENFLKIISEIKNDHGENAKTSIIKEIEDILNKEISDLEDACYDRLHVHKNNSAPLEYRGGIQQYLTSFDFAFKQINRVFVPEPEDNNAVYVTITGAERASSERRLFRLNIHDIVFPELYVASVWKEVANFSLMVQKSFDYDESEMRKIKKGKTNFDPEIMEKSINLLNTWNNFISQKKSFNIIADRIRQSEKLKSDDNVCSWVLRNITPELVEYFMSDYLVFHFAFSENFNLMWHFYFKILLQTTNVYSNLNHIHKRDFINMLLRLFMVAILAMNENDNEKNREKIEEFIKSKKNAPFDSIVGSQWFECYQKVFDATQEIYSVLESYGFYSAVRCMCESMESNIQEKEQHIKSIKDCNILDVFTRRNNTIETYFQYLSYGYLIKDSYGEFSFLLNLWAAYLKAVYALDYDECGLELPIKCLPRDCDGMISDVMEIKNGRKNDVYDNMTRILVDTTGGFFVPSSKIRRKYFRLRTAFYRSLWNYCFMYKKTEENDK